MCEPCGLRIAAIHNATTGARGAADEWLVIHNEGAQRWPLHEWKLMASTDPEPTVFSFPIRLANGAVWSFEPGESIYLFTGHGRDCFTIPTGQRPQFHFYWNRDAMVWDNAGAGAYLRSVDGRFATEPFLIP